MSNTSTRRRLIAAIDKNRRSMNGLNRDYITGYNETFSALKSAASHAVGIAGVKEIDSISRIITKIAACGFVAAETTDTAGRQTAEYLLGAKHAAVNIRQAIIIEDII